MRDFATKQMSTTPEHVAPDGSDVRELLSLQGGGLAHFELAAGQTSIAVAHQTVEEIWFFLGGRGQMWRRQVAREQIVDVYAGVSITIPQGTCFQFRSEGPDPLAAVGVTMPPWPGMDEAVEVDGIWEPSSRP